MKAVLRLPRTSAQQLDATFSTSASLEIFELDLTDPALDMKSCATFSSPHRYHKLIWSPHKTASDETLSGVLIAGGENGNIILYDPAKILAGETEVVIAQNDKHTGPVRALDVNLFQTNLVASGANESEIYIWDLNNFATPMTPGSKTQPPEDISCIAWNRQVQHILASASPSGRATVWDLRKNEPIIKVSDHSNRVATQMVLASEDDRLPVIQIWDLRFASSPLRILTIAWSMADPELLLSCGKDSKILCSNPNTGEVLYELPTSTQWCFDVQWCPRNPALLSAASFDGRISVYSIMGGSTDSLRQKQADKLSSSFGDLDPFGTGHPLPPLQLPQQTSLQSTVLPLKKPPKWIRRPVGASFSFGGRLVTFENSKTQQQGEHPQQPYHVYISQVVTEKEFLSRSNQLQEAVQAEAFVSYCQKKIDVAKNDFERNVWSFLKVHFEEDSRGKYLQLLGYKKDGLRQKITSTLAKESPQGRDQDEAHEEADTLAQPDGGEGLAAKDQLLPENKIIELDSLQPINETFNISVTGAGGQELLSKTQKKYFAKTRGKITRLITAVVTKNWKEIVQSCDLQNWKEALAAVLTYARPDEFAVLCDLLGSRLENEGDSVLQTQACLCYICAGNVEKLVSCWTKAQDGSNPLSLQDLIEKVVILRKAVQQTQVMDANAVGVLLAEKMSHYANLLASQGSIAAAPTSWCYGTGSAKRRESFPGAQRHPQHPTRGNQQPRGGVALLLVRCRCRKTQLRSIISRLELPLLLLPGRENPPPPPGFIMQKDMNPHMPPHQPAQPDYNMYTRQPCPQPCQPTQPYTFRPSLYQPQQPPLAPPTSTAYPASNPPYMPSNPASAMPPPLYSSQPQASPTSLNPSPSLPAPPPSGASFQHGRPGAPPSSLPSYALPPGPTVSWLLPKEQNIIIYKTKPVSCKVPDSFLPPVPITAPIMTPLSDPQSQLQQPPTSAPPPTQVPFQPSHLPPGQPGLQNPFQNVPPPGVQTIMTPAVSASSMEGAPGAPIGNTMQHMQSLPTEKITKKPIPEEHLILKTTFEALIQRCLSSATDPQTKRKLDDANKRLEFLSIETRNYTEGLNIHTHIVSTSNFSETSAFMPVLKVVLTQANKLGV
ncbi:hypothetical protein E2320_007461 [Naja naja]|nr:hypothetical protein E2320_007461 [Naja naja]